MFRRYSQTFQADSPYETILTCPKPTIAMVNGPALAGGLALVLSADLAIGSEPAVFGVPEGKLGLSDHYVATLLRWKIGVSRATYMTLTADMVTAEVAASWGLVVETVPADKLEDRTMRIAGAIQAISPEARAMYKTSAIGELPLLNDARPTVRSALTQNAREGVRAFLER